MGKEDWIDTGAPRPTPTDHFSPPGLPQCLAASPLHCQPGKATLRRPLGDELPRCGCTPDVDLDLVGCLLVRLVFFCCCCLDLNIFFCFVFCFVIFFVFLFLPFMVREGDGGRFHYNRNRNEGLRFLRAGCSMRGHHACGLGSDLKPHLPLHLP